MLTVHINVQLPEQFRADLERQIEKETNITYRKKIEGENNLYIFQTENPMELVILGMLITKQHTKHQQLTLTF